MHKTPDIARLIHENLWTVLSFAFAQPAIGRFINDKFRGEWKYLHKTIYEHAEFRADRALLEMATQLRVLDDAEGKGLSNYLMQTQQAPLGTVLQGDGSRTDLHFRDMTNKIMHGSHYEWRLGDDKPTVIISSDQPDRWQNAELSLVHLMGLIGNLGIDIGRYFRHGASLCARYHSIPAV
jgi:hypothetical protein